ncbi:Maf family protein [Caldisericum exile]|uniref:dTTP/UTP pyrophosphatase n=1 Tax=Caldisericum exile (strain DSM 21853 / NBRC 104410 / AZM16c01) TaxID=511051 RepID=A0A7U6GET0_CALEA|nr:Maf family protein [Caldisericum exile]BAL81077.1 Maf-like protein [Caldisericum exile AZM16c01]
MRFILASSSERRIEYLKNFGFDFEVKKIEVTEKIFNNDPVKTVVYNAYMKAYKVRKHYNLPVVGMDTIVELNGRIFGKPKDEKENVKMIKKLLGNSHRVITGIVALKDEFSIIDYEISIVHFRKEVDMELIKKYVASKEGLDKAGGYAIQGLGSIFIDEVSGPLDNVIGVPILKVHEILKMMEEV